MGENASLPWRMEGLDDDSGMAFEGALNDKDFSGLAALAAHFRARAERAEGEIKGQALLVEYLKHRVKVLEARERGEDVYQIPTPG